MKRLLPVSILLLLISFSVAVAVEPKGQRVLGIAVNEVPGADYESSFAAAREARLQAVELSLNWDDIEKEPGVYRLDPDWLDIAAAFYPQHGTRVVLVINAIDTVADRRPHWLKEKSWDDPAVTKAYSQLVLWALAKARRLSLASLALSNEVDVFLDNAPSDWPAFIRFATAARVTIKRRYPGLAAGVKTTLSSLRSANAAQARRLHRQMDVAMLNYYPLNTDFTAQPPSRVATDIASAVALLPGKRIQFTEIGYPASTQCGSSLELQAEFVRQVFKAWDKHRKEIALMNFVWLNDIGREELLGYAQYYGVRDRCFLQYLATLGLRKNGVAKSAFKTLAEEAHARGW